jgi:hypothetical protein
MVSSVSKVPDASNLDFCVQELNHMSAAIARIDVLFIIVVFILVDVAGQATNNCLVF